MTLNGEEIAVFFKNWGVSREMRSQSRWTSSGLLPLHSSPSCPRRLAQATHATAHHGILRPRIFLVSSGFFWGMCSGLDFWCFWMFFEILFLDVCLNVCLNVCLFFWDGVGLKKVWYLSGWSCMVSSNAQINIFALNICDWPWQYQPYAIDLVFSQAPKNQK